ncbi:acyl-ACP--UDP-N-acetylglucosamine O-acyltransferase [Zavarzinella formosa]|uniref:acyl-ACP--UDP-N-acetylglucosamine O-acyltransferase n=1 Tax=Zavarzinella formosa TaxID=360055 RepID=UPI0002E7F84B|nr:acyl-ACP--UDP-N-acetylglucosamine O-acyltransferase [Zavarzinella formosa]
MPVHPTARIHPTAIIPPEATIGEGVEIGPFTVLEGDVRIGTGTTVAPHVHLIGPLKIGEKNRIGTGCVFGAEPQHLSYAGQPASVEIGDRNVFKEQVTVHRGSHLPGWGVTRIGNDGYFMVNSHFGHDAQVGNNVILANGALLGGHVVVQDRAFVSGNAGVHQHARIGRLAITTGCIAIVQDLLPFMTLETREEVAGVNVLGLRRAGYSAGDISIVREAYKIIYRSGNILKVSFEQLAARFPDHPLINELLVFAKASKRGVIRPMGSQSPNTDA